MKTKKLVLLLKILFVALIMVCIMQLVFTIIPQISVKVQIYLFSLRLPIEITDASTLNSLQWYIFVCALPIYLLILYTIIKLINLFQPLAQGKTPFTHKSVAEIRQIGFACWIYAGVKTIVEYSAAQFLLRSAKYELMGWNNELTFPVTSIIVGAIILSVGEVFAQGLALKQDNDSIV